MTSETAAPEAVVPDLRQENAASVHRQRMLDGGATLPMAEAYADFRCALDEVFAAERQLREARRSLRCADVRLVQLVTPK